MIGLFSLVTMVCLINGSLQKNLQVNGFVAFYDRGMVAQLFEIVQNIHTTMKGKKNFIASY